MLSWKIKIVMFHAHVCLIAERMCVYMYIYVNDQVMARRKKVIILDHLLMAPQNSLVCVVMVIDGWHVSHMEERNIP